MNHSALSHGRPPQELTAGMRQERLTAMTVDAISRRRPAAALVCWVGATALAFLVLGTYWSNRELIYDEPAYLLGSVASVDQYGFTREFLVQFPEPAGIAFGVLHWFLRPITNLEPRAVRMVNPILLVLVIAVIMVLLRQSDAEKAASSAWSVMAVPFVWVLTGLALTEMVGMALAVVGLWLAVEAHRGRLHDRRFADVALAALGGVAVGLSFYSRPPLMLAACGLVVLMVARPRPWRSMASFTVSALVVILPALLLWRGLVPPKVQHFNALGFSVPNMVLSLGYAGAAMFVLSPGWFRIGMLRALAIVAVGVMANVLFVIVSIAPFATLVNASVPTALQPYYALVAGGMCVGVGLLFTVTFVANVIENRDDRQWLVYAIGMFVLVVSVGKITHQFSSRYTGIAAPLMVLAAARYQTFTPRHGALLAFGLAGGAASLISYLVSTY